MSPREEDEKREGEGQEKSSVHVVQHPVEQCRSSRRASCQSGEEFLNIVHTSMNCLSRLSNRRVKTSDLHLNVVR